MEKELLEAQKEIVRLLAILVKLDKTQASLITELGSVGFGSKRIAELLNTSPNTVSVALSVTKKKTKK